MDNQKFREMLAKLTATRDRSLRRLLTDAYNMGVNHCSKPTIDRAETLSGSYRIGDGASACDTVIEDIERTRDGLLIDP